MYKYTPLTDPTRVRKRASEHPENGAAVIGQVVDKAKIIQLLNDSLATEIVCTLRYRRHHFMSKGIYSKTVSNELLVRANQELGHADILAERIVQLGGAPDFSPDELSSRSHAEYVEADNLIDMVKENLVAEHIAIDNYREIIQYLGDRDTTTRHLLEDILQVEEDHAEEMSGLLDNLTS